ncbi:MAG TPA: winged helix DNA-binding domain-containing protein [Pseudonocardiaceae bacterium]|jgi:hypothetical protein|nr:winged helix DNA-binding domain-containing protein [Pseudonocardiaceae bacterium]
MTALPTIGPDQRRARLGRRHRLAADARADTPVQVAESLLALHGSDPASVVLAVLARTRQPDSAAVEDALYERRELVRLLGMRRTMFVVPVATAPVLQAACTDLIAARERKKLLQVIEQYGIATDPAGWLRDVEDTALRALAARGTATAAELAQDEPRLRTAILASPDKSYAAKQNLGTRVLFGLGAQGRIVRGRPRGSWTSSQYTWWPAASWLTSTATDWAAETAQVELVRRWLASFGPGTVEDLRWWTGLTLGQVRTALARIGPAEVDLGGVTGLVLGDDVDPVPEPEPWVALLPALDPTPMGWNQRDWFLGEHAAALFDRSGNIGPTVWSDGRIVGGWGQRKDGEIAFRLLTEVGAEVTGAVRSAAEQLAADLGDTRVTPRFRTPLERELTASG